MWPFSIILVAFSLLPFFLVFLFLYLLVYWLGRREQRALCMYGLFAAVVTAPFDLLAYMHPVVTISQERGAVLLTFFALPAWGMFILSVLSLLKSWHSRRYAACWLTATALYLFNAAVYTLLTFNRL